MANVKRGPKRKPVEATRIPRGMEADWKPPKYLKGAAVHAWNHVVRLIARTGNLARTDPQLAELYAINVAMIRGAYEQVGEDGPTTLGPNGNIVTHPAMASINSATMRLKAIVNELGLSPASSKYAASAVTAAPTSPTSNKDNVWDDVLTFTA